MVRTVISLENSEKKWLDKQAHLRHVPMTEIVREALRHYRSKIESEKQPTIENLLAQTAGIWKKGDGLEYQKKLRDEWE
ncbi:MAG: ribbon-helix-helix protein, CopG family [Gammaproteobacteria bacterium]